MDVDQRSSRFDLLVANEVAQQLGSDLDGGLDPADAARRLRAVGPNELPPPHREHWALRFLRQFREPMALLLLAAAAIDGIILGERVDAVAILAIVILNAVIALVQEGKAARDLEALRKMETPTARVVRRGAPRTIPSPEVVPGDLVLLAAGDRVPADVRLSETSSCEIDESLLTGESLPVTKDASVVGEERDALADRTGMAFTGTLVTKGAARGITVATGTATELGAIAEGLGGPEQSTPLQVDLARLTAKLGSMAVVISIGVFGLTFLRLGLSVESLERAFLPAVALAVAAVPEGLATVVTVALALGVRRMAERGAIVRRLPAVETLGSTTRILTDKTGTLTENRLRMDSVVLRDALEMSATDLDPVARRSVAEIAILCNDAALEPPSGDPLEVALLEAFRDDLPGVRTWAGARAGEEPFDPTRKLMSTVYRSGRPAMLLVKGAPEAILARCETGFAADGTEPTPLRDDERAALLSEVERLAGRGMRMLGLARRELAEMPAEPAAEEHDLTFVALVGLRDPVRPEAATAVAETVSAGVRLTMVTGDHAATAVAIASEVGLAPAGAPVLTGAALREQGLPPDPARIPIYARVDPEEKLALVEAFRSNGDVVAVTGDGVNDAPALRKADIGVAMGRSGSDVAREASDMVVTDDNLATIVSAVREGRGIYDNIRKVVDYLVGGNLSEISVVVGSLLLFPELAVPLLPLQLLWINLLTDGLPAIALGVDPPDPHLMARPPRRPGARLLTARRVWFLFGRGLCIALSAIASLAVARFAWDLSWAHARTVMFTVLVTAHLLYAFVVQRPPGASGGELRRLVSNRWLLLAVGSGLLLQLVILLWPPAQELFRTVPLSLQEWCLVVAGAILAILAMLVLLPDRGHDASGSRLGAG